MSADFVEEVTKVGCCLKGYLPVAELKFLGWPGGGRSYD